jgi:hypothetical protein
VNPSVWIGLGIFAAALVALWVLIRLAFPKTSSTSARAIGIVISLIVFGRDIRYTADALYSMSRIVVSNLSNHTQVRLDQILTLADKIPSFNLLLAFITLGILVRLISALDQGAKPKWLQNFQGTSLAFRTNLLVLLIFFLGIYLAVGSLCTIPSLTVNQPFTEEERTQINAEVDVANPKGDAFDKEFPAAVPLPPDNLGHLRSVLAKSTGETPLVPHCETAASAPGAAEPNSGGNVTAKTTNIATTSVASEVTLLQKQPQVQQDIRSLLMNFDQARCSRRDEYYTMRGDVARFMRVMADSAKNVLSSNLALRLTGRDRANYLYEQKARISNNSILLQAALSACMHGLSAAEYVYQYPAGQYESWLAQAQSNSATQTVPSVYPEYALSGSGTGQCIFPMEIYARSEDNYAETAQLGVFSQWFGWLENSDSLALSVLIGMLGVGLVGAVVSSFVRQSPTPDRPSPELAGSRNAIVARLEKRFRSIWIADPFPVVVRGFTAAVVVYLAVEGGLNIFSAGSNQANPYVLLFVCMVGAVFSEDVWVIARRNLPAAEKGHYLGSPNAQDSEIKKNNGNKDDKKNDED